MEEIEMPIVALPGAEGWTRAYELGEVLDKKFPNQDASEWAYACEYNDSTPADGKTLTNIRMVVQGENDGDAWVWLIEFNNKEKWICIGQCDYTGWDCQSNLEWKQVGFGGRGY